MRDPCCCDVNAECVMVRQEKLPVYATTARPDLAKALGFVGAKIPLPYGPGKGTSVEPPPSPLFTQSIARSSACCPGDGDEGMRKNIERIKEVRWLGGSYNLWLAVRMYHCVWNGRAGSRRCWSGLPADDRLLHVPHSSVHGGARTAGESCVPCLARASSSAGIAAQSPSPLPRPP